MKLIRSLLITPVCFAACLAGLFSAHVAAQQDFASRAQAFVDAWANDGQFSGVVAVARNGTPVFVKAVGMASTDWAAANGSDTKMRLGSISKQFTAVCILQLQEQGKLAVEQALSDFIPELPEAWRGVTLHQLLSHTSGIPNYTAYSTYQGTQKVTQWDVLNTVRNIPMRFDPGTKYEYSNTNFFLLGMVIERVSGIAYDEYLRRNIFVPASMQNSGYDHQSRTIPGRATGYLGDSRRPQAADYLETDWPFAAGALYSTVNDLIAWNEALESGKLISAQSLAKMRTPVLNNYGYGIVINSNPYFVYHDGGINGFAAFLLYFPADHVSIVALSNFETAPIGSIANGIAVLYYNTGNPTPALKPEAAVSEDLLAQYAGRYQNPAKTTILTVTLEEGLLYGRFNQGSKFVMFASSDSEFFVKFSGSTWQFNLDNDAVSALTYRASPTAQPVTWQRLPDQ